MATRVQGLSRAIKAMRDISSGEFYKRPAHRYSLKVKAEVKEYPPALDPSWYRSGELKRKWFANVKDGDVVFQNEAHSKRGTYYAAYVQARDGEPNQVWWHKRTGWKTIEDVSEKHLDFFKSEVVKEIKRLV